MSITVSVMSNDLIRFVLQPPIRGTLFRGMRPVAHNGTGAPFAGLTQTDLPASPYACHRPVKYRLMQTMTEREAPYRSGKFERLATFASALSALAAGRRRSAARAGKNRLIDGTGGTHECHQTVNQGGHPGLHSAVAWYHIDRRFPLAAMLSQPMYAAMRCNLKPEQIWALSETFMVERRNLIRCGLRAPSMPLVVQRRPLSVAEATRACLRCATIV